MTNLFNPAAKMPYSDDEQDFIESIAQRIGETAADTAQQVEGLLVDVAAEDREEYLTMALDYAAEVGALPQSVEDLENGEGSASCENCRFSGNGCALAGAAFSITRQFRSMLVAPVIPDFGQACKCYEPESGDDDNDRDGSPSPDGDPARMMQVERQMQDAITA